MLNTSFLFLVKILFIVGPSASAQLGAVNGKVKEAPRSLSYDAVLRCYPELKNDNLSLRVDLNLLKEEVDRKHATVRSHLLERLAVFNDTSDVKKRTRLWTLDAPTSPKPQYRFQLEYFDDKGLTHEQIVPPAHKINPKQKDLNAYYVTAQFEMDQSTYIDTKLNGYELRYKKNFDRVLELRLLNIRARKDLRCDQDSLGAIVCECIKK